MASAGLGNVDFSPIKKPPRGSAEATMMAASTMITDRHNNNSAHGVTSATSSTTTTTTTTTPSPMTTPPRPTSAARGQYRRSSTDPVANNSADNNTTTTTTNNSKLLKKKKIFSSSKAKEWGEFCLENQTDKPIYFALEGIHVRFDKKPIIVNEVRPGGWGAFVRYKINPRSYAAGHFHYNKYLADSFILYLELCTTDQSTSHAAESTKHARFKHVDSMNANLVSTSINEKRAAHSSGASTTTTTTSPTNKNANNVICRKYKIAHGLNDVLLAARVNKSLFLFTDYKTLSVTPLTYRIFANYQPSESATTFALQNNVSAEKVRDTTSQATRETPSITASLLSKLGNLTGPEKPRDQELVGGVQRRKRSNSFNKFLYDDQDDTSLRETTLFFLAHLYDMRETINLLVIRTGTGDQPSTDDLRDFILDLLTKNGVRSSSIVANFKEVQEWFRRCVKFIYASYEEIEKENYSLTYSNHKTDRCVYLTDGSPSPTSTPPSTPITPAATIGLMPSPLMLMPSLLAPIFDSNNSSSSSSSNNNNNNNNNSDTPLNLSCHGSSNDLFELYNELNNSNDNSFTMKMEEGEASPKASSSNRSSVSPQSLVLSHLHIDGLIVLSKVGEHLRQEFKDNLRRVEGIPMLLVLSGLEKYADLGEALHQTEKSESDVFRAFSYIKPHVVHIERQHPGDDSTNVDNDTSGITIPKPSPSIEHLPGLLFMRKVIDVAIERITTSKEMMEQKASIKRLMFKFAARKQQLEKDQNSEEARSPESKRYIWLFGLDNEKESVENAIKTLQRLEHCPYEKVVCIRSREQYANAKGTILSLDASDSIISSLSLMQQTNLVSKVVKLQQNLTDLLNFSSWAIMGNDANRQSKSDPTIITKPATIAAVMASLPAQPDINAAAPPQVQTLPTAGSKPFQLQDTKATSRAAGYESSGPEFSSNDEDSSSSGSDGETGIGKKVKSMRKSISGPSLSNLLKEYDKTSADWKAPISHAKRNLSYDLITAAKNMLQSSSPSSAVDNDPRYQRHLEMRRRNRQNSLQEWQGPTISQDTTKNGITIQQSPPSTDMVDSVDNNSTNDRAEVTAATATVSQQDAASGDPNTRDTIAANAISISRTTISRTDDNNSETNTNADTGLANDQGKAPTGTISDAKILLTSRPASNSTGISQVPSHVKPQIEKGDIVVLCVELSGVRVLLTGENGMFSAFAKEVLKHTDRLVLFVDRLDRSERRTTSPHANNNHSTTKNSATVHDLGNNKGTYYGDSLDLELDESLRETQQVENYFKQRCYYWERRDDALNNSQLASFWGNILKNCRHV